MNSNLLIYVTIFFLIIFGAVAIYFLSKKKKLSKKNQSSEQLTNHFNDWWEKEIQHKLKKDKVQKTKKIYEKIKEFDASDANTME